MSLSYTFISPLTQQGSQQSLKALLFTGLLLALLLGGCKSASTPTQAQMPAQPQSQTSEVQTQEKSQSQSQSQSQQGVDPASPSTSSARSDEEIIADFDDELDASIAVFDGMILDERAKAEAIEASLGGEGSSEGGGELGGASGGDGSLFEDADIYEGLPGYGDFPDNSDQGDDNDEQQVSHTDATPNNGASGSESAGAIPPSSGANLPAAKTTSTKSNTASPGGPQTTQRGEIPEDIKGGSDDDIVARQIREAALKEKDPALREKLWDEYRKYKNQQ